MKSQLSVSEIQNTYPNLLHVNGWVYALASSLKCIVVADAVFFVLHLIAPETSFAWRIAHWLLSHPLAFICGNLSLTVLLMVWFYKCAERVAGHTNGDVILLQRGLISLHWTIIERESITHVYITKNFVEKAFGLASISIYTTGSPKETVRVGAVDETSLERLMLTLNIATTDGRGPNNEQLAKP